MTPWTMARIEEHSIPEPNTGCWLWLDGLVHGYGRCFVGDNHHDQAHRMSWRLANGPIPEGFEVHHKCRQRSCVNPAHLEALSYADHRAADFPNGPINGNVKKTHCLRGHELSGRNLIMEPSRRAKSGFSRRCRECQNLRKRKPKT